jgi:gamma-glutamyltranspeptidase/glutathione hydrolase
MRARAAALASDPDVEEAAKRELARSNSAVAAVAAGFFASAGSHADVLLGPLALLVAGLGVGGLAFDGRLRQPGLGTRRPRGFLSSEEVPVAARAALPTGIGALTVALAHDPARTLTQVAKVGVQRARAAGARERARVIERVAAVGPAALSESAFVRPLLHLASPSEGGLLSPADFVPGGELVRAAEERRVASKLCYFSPFAERGKLPPGTETILAVDSRGVFAVLVARRVTDGLAVDALGLVLSLEGVPVERGQPRVRPGARLPLVADLSVACDRTRRPVTATARSVPVGKRKAWTLVVAQNELRWVTATRS